MSITSVGTLGNGVVGGTGSTTCTLTTSAAIEAGNVALLWWSSENSSTSDGNTSEHTSVTDSAGAVSWTKLYEYCNANGAANAGITTSLWYRPKQGSDLSSASTITGTRVDSRLDQTMLAWEFATTYDLIDDTSGPVGNVTDASNGFGSASFSSLTSKERLYFRALGKKANVASTTDLTPTTDFTITSNIRSRNNAAATLARGEFRINTSTGETSDPTFAFSGDTAAIFVGLVEDVPVTGTATFEAGGGALAASGAVTAPSVVRRPVLHQVGGAGRALMRNVWRASALFVLPAGPVVGTSEVFGTATFTAGGGALAATGGVGLTGTATFEAGGGALAATGTVSADVTGSATFEAGGAALAASGGVVGDSRVVLRYQWAQPAPRRAWPLSARIVRGRTGDAPTTGTATFEAGGGALAASGTVAATVTGTATFAVGGGALAANGVQATTGTATFEAGGGAMAATGVQATTGTATFEAGGAAFAATGGGVATGTATFEAGGSAFAATGNIGQVATATFAAGGGTLAATGTVSGTGLLALAITHRAGSRYAATGRTTTRYAISESIMATISTESSAYLWLTEDQEFEVELSQRDTATGALEAATGLSGLTVHIAATAGGSVIGGLTFNLSERGATGVYYAIMDTATLTGALSTSSYPDGTALYVVLAKSGDIASRSWRKIVRRQRVGDG